LIEGKAAFRLKLAAESRENSDGLIAERLMAACRENPIS
jgi:hypothetical protein